MQDVEDANAVDGDEGGEVRGDVDLLQGASLRMERLQGLAGLCVPPLTTNRQKEETSEKRGHDVVTAESCDAQRNRCSAEEDIWTTEYEKVFCEI